jgi:hypothetical protein
MKTLLTSKALGAALLAALLVCVRAEAADSSPDALDLVRSIYKTDRQAFVADSLQLTERESAAFWPLYRSYRADMENIGDGLVKLVLEYADQYPNVPEDSARRMLKQYLTLEKRLVAKRAWYLKRAGKTLPADKVLRWAQVESRMDLGLRLQLASTIPLVPTERRKPAATP